jgi:hypothetical protein
MEATLMKQFGIGSTTLVLLLFGASYSFAQDKPDQHQEDNKAPHQEQSAKPAQHEEKAPAAQHEEKAPAAQHEEKAPPAQAAKRTEPAKTVKPTEHAAQTEQAKPAKQHTESATRTSPNETTTENTHATANAHAQKTENVSHSQQAHNFGGHGGGHIDDVHFRASFGNEHHFRMNRPVIYEGYSRFNYGGYYFGFYDPWPSDWGYSDDVYVDYIDGQYYLINPEHPGPRLTINVVL